MNVKLVTNESVTFPLFGGKPPLDWYNRKFAWWVMSTI